MRAVSVALTLKFQSVVSATEQVYFDLKGLELKTIRLADLLKIHLGVELDPPVRKSSYERSRLTACNPPKQEADRRSKSKHSEIFLKSMLFWPEPRSGECHFLSLKLSTLCYALMNSVVPYINQVLPLL